MCVCAHACVCNLLAPPLLEVLLDSGPGSPQQQLQVFDLHAQRLKVAKGVFVPASRTKELLSCVAV